MLYIILVILLSFSTANTNASFSQRTIEPSIKGIFISKSKRLALVDNKYLTDGDTTAAGKIVAILKDRIVIKNGKLMKVIFVKEKT